MQGKTTGNVSTNSAYRASIPRGGTRMSAMSPDREVVLFDVGVQGTGAARVTCG
jgi:hypothetical protein